MIFCLTIIPNCFQADLVGDGECFRPLEATTFTEVSSQQQRTVALDFYGKLILAGLCRFRF